VASPRSVTSSHPAVSIVLPVLNEARDIGNLLDQVVAQVSPQNGFEVIVADGGSTDDTLEIVSGFADRWPNVRLIPNEKMLSSAGRNVGARAATGKYVLFLDGHCHIPLGDYLVRMVDIFESSQAECLCRSQPLNRILANEWAKAISMARHSRLGHAAGSDIYGGAPGFTDPRSAGAAYVRARIDELGGYDERFDACEDVEFNYRVAKAGLRSYVHPDLSIHYRPRSSPKGLFFQMVRYGRGRARLMVRHPGAVPWPLVFVTGFALVTLLVLLLVGPRLAGLMAVVGIGAWVLLITAESVRLAGLSISALRVGCSFFMIYVGLVLGFWRGLPEFSRFRAPQQVELVANENRL